MIVAPDASWHADAPWLEDGAARTRTGTVIRPTRQSSSDSIAHAVEAGFGAANVSLDRVSRRKTAVSRVDRPYIKAIEILEDLNVLRVPDDILQCLLACAQAIYRSARENAVARASEHAYDEVGADSFLPIFIYVVIHSDLPHVHRTLHMVSQYSSESERMAESGYYVTCFEGAITYLMNVTPAEIEKLRRP